MKARLKEREKNPCHGLDLMSFDHPAKGGSIIKHTTADKWS